MGVPSVFPAILKMNDKGTFWVAILLVAIQISASWALPYTKSEEEAPYKVIRKTEKYEIRSYLPWKWVCTDHTGAEFNKRQQAVAFLTLFGYVNGENSAGVNISIPAPTTVRSISLDDEPDQFVFQMCMFLPTILQENTPEPLEDGMYIQHRKKLTVAARKFNHYMMKENEWEVQMEILKNDLKAAGETNMDFDDSYGAAFDPPFDVDGRPNEVWVVKKD